MFEVPQVVCLLHHHRGEDAQPLYDLSCIVKPTHVRVAGYKVAVRRG